MSKSLFDLTPEDPEVPFSTEAQLHGDGRALATDVIGSKEYRESIRRRLQADSLPPAVELFYLHTLYGKPTERRELTFPEGIPDFANMTTDELAARAEKVARELRAARSAALVVETPKEVM